MKASGGLQRTSELGRKVETARAFLRRGQVSGAKSLQKTRGRRRRRDRPVVDALYLLDLQLGFAIAGRGPRLCAGCGYEGKHVEAHHTIPEQVLERILGRLYTIEIQWDRRNALCLCDEPAPNRCHTRHHLAVKRVGRQGLRTAVWEFAAELDELVPGDPFTLYLETTYPALEEEAA